MFRRVTSAPTTDKPIPLTIKVDDDNVQVKPARLQELFPKICNSEGRRI
jgi:hypothetical protein